jgi:hypothetical protein
VAGWQELFSVLMDDQALPAHTRLVIAQKSRSAAARSNKARAKTTNAKSAASSQKQAAVEHGGLWAMSNTPRCQIPSLYLHTKLYRNNNYIGVRTFIPTGAPGGSMT